MDHTDWIGIGYFVTSVCAGLVLIYNTILHKNNGDKLNQVSRKVNGGIDKLFEEAKQAAIREIEDRLRRNRPGEGPPAGA